MDSWDIKPRAEVPDAWEDDICDETDSAHCAASGTLLNEPPKKLILAKKNTHDRGGRETLSGASSLRSKRDLEKLSHQKEKDYEQFKAQLFNEIDRNKKKSAGAGGRRKPNNDKNENGRNLSSAAVLKPSKARTGTSRVSKSNGAGSGCGGEYSRDIPHVVVPDESEVSTDEPGLATTTVVPDRTSSEEFPSLFQSYKR
eukprot:TRINITY_DN630_c0_g1_i2.p1 TRINITY_DN630_c0_g1~~TRINITY_DN630_c0_g1_i2.p1  ORF type:complete len:199 (-),score=42.30 TRINITY_DN630_c0_g1_i2:191-787(-)